MENYQGLAISSGGFKGIGILGFLQAQHFNGNIKNCNVFAGASVGSALCLLLAVGWTPYELFFKIINIKIFSSFSDLDLYGLQSDHGMVDIKLLKEELEPLVIEKRQSKKVKLPTLLDLHNEGIYIAFSVTDRVSRGNVKLDYKNHPNLLATDACLWSSSVPFIIKPTHYKGMILSDGALSNPFPVDYIDDGKTKILAISAFGAKDASSEGFLDHITNTFMIPVEELQRNKAKAVSENVDVVELIVHDINILDQNASDIAKCKMFLKGTKDGVIFSDMLHKKKEIIKARRRLNDRHHRLHRPHYQEKKEESKPTKIELNIPQEVVLECLTSVPLKILSEYSKRNPKSMLDIYNRLNPKDAQLIYNFLTLFEVKEEPKTKRVFTPPSQPPPPQEKASSPKPVKKKVPPPKRHRQQEEIVIEEVDEYDEILNSYSGPGSTASKINASIHQTLHSLPPGTQVVVAEALNEIGEEKVKRGIQSIGFLVDTFRLFTGRSIGWRQPPRPPRSMSANDRNVIGEIIEEVTARRSSPKIEIMEEE